MCVFICMYVYIFAKLYFMTSNNTIKINDECSHMQIALDRYKLVMFMYIIVCTVMYIYIYIYTYIHTYIHIYIYIYVYIYIYI